MFIKARSLMGAEKLQELGRLMETRKEELMEEWTNPVTGLLKKAQSMVEKVMPTSAKHAKVEANRERVR
jgi:hypothetical protein